jgi:hypothetical protein
LKSKNEKEKEYLQKTIIMMELKQLAESIMIIKSRKAIHGDMNEYEFENRPLLWAERLL